MPSGIGIGFGHHLDTKRATQEAIESAVESSQSKTPKLALLITTVHYNPNTIIDTVKNLLPNTQIIGCSSAGIILPNSIKTRGIAILFLDIPEMSFGISAIENLKTQNLQNAGSELAQKSLQELKAQGRQVFLFFIDGHLENNSHFIKGVQNIFGNIFPVVGAGTSDDFHFNNTFQFYQNKVLRHAAVGLILGGQINVSIASRHGWRPLGKPRTITESYSNIIKKINDKPAVTLYEEYLGKESDDIRSKHLSKIALLYPLGLYIEGSQEYLLRNAVDILSDGSIVCQGDVPQGSTVHVMIGNKESCAQAAFEAACEAKKDLLGKEAKLIIVIESMARLKLLGRQAFKEIQEIKTVFGKDTPIIGFYANGEICPFQTTDQFKKPLLQNESITVLAIS
ncbi:MAG: hypothetical protein ACI9F2_000070 [Lysobacterales bacterium]